MAKYSADPVIEALRKAGLADEYVRRVVIDIRVNEVPVVYIERYGDEQLLSVAEAFAGVEVTRG